MISNFHYFIVFSWFLSANRCLLIMMIFIYIIFFIVFTILHFCLDVRVVRRSRSLCAAANVEDRTSVSTNLVGNLDVWRRNMIVDQQEICKYNTMISLFQMYLLFSYWIVEKDLNVSLVTGFGYYSIMRPNKNEFEKLQNVQLLTIVKFTIYIRFRIAFTTLP